MLDARIEIKKETNKFLNYLTAKRFTNPKNPRKFSAKFYRDELFTASVSGQGILIETVKKMHEKDPYKNVDELIGDLEMMGIEMLNDFQIQSGKVKAKMYRVEDYQKGKVLNYEK